MNIKEKRLYIVVEGKTEEKFVDNILAPYLKEKSAQLGDVRPVRIHIKGGGHGGMVKYEFLRKDIPHLLREGDAPIVSTLIDFFRCPDTPGKEVWDKTSNHHQEVELREQEMGRDIGSGRFIPYIQLHEFEALLFSSDVGFKKELSPKEAGKLSKIVADYPNPEDINTTPNGAPSKRILAIVPDYKKVVQGNAIAQLITIGTILERCPRFRAWVERLISACSHE